MCCMAVTSLNAMNSQLCIVSAGREHGDCCLGEKVVDIDHSVDNELNSWAYREIGHGQK